MIGRDTGPVGEITDMLLSVVKNITVTVYTFRQSKESCISLRTRVIPY